MTSQVWQRIQALGLTLVHEPGQQPYVSYESTTLADTPSEQYALMCSKLAHFQGELEKLGFEIDDPYIDHDSISGFLVEWDA